MFCWKCSDVGNCKLELLDDSLSPRRHVFEASFGLAACGNLPLLGKRGEKNQKGKPPEIRVVRCWRSVRFFNPTCSHVAVACGEVENLHSGTSQFSTSDFPLRIDPRSTMEHWNTQGPNKQSVRFELLKSKSLETSRYVGGTKRYKEH